MEKATDLYDVQKDLRGVAWQGRFELLSLLVQLP
jgi:hypothetical protein